MRPLPTQAHSTPATPAEPEPAPLRRSLRAVLARWATLLRSALTGGAATLVDLALIALAVGCFGIPARVANVPALLCGAAVQFFGNRHYAFRAASGSLGRQAALFAATEVVALILNAVLYDLAVTRVVPGTWGAVALRALTTNLVFLLWSYPVWRRVFKPAGPSAALFSSCR